MVDLGVAGPRVKPEITTNKENDDDDDDEGLDLFIYNSEDLTFLLIILMLY